MKVSELVFNADNHYWDVSNPIEHPEYGIVIVNRSRQYNPTYDIRSGEFLVAISCRPDRSGLEHLGPLGIAELGALIYQARPLPKE